MSFLGSLGNMMKGSGLEEVFSEVYAEHTVVHMVSRKAISRALHAHFLAESALVTILTEDIIEENHFFIFNFNDIKEISEKIKTDEIETFQKKFDLSSRSRTVPDFRLKNEGSSTKISLDT